VAYRILSLDGGGFRALIQIMTLADLYSSAGAVTGHSVLSDFDLVVAGSGSSIILGCLLKDLPLSDIQGCFEDPVMRRAIFARSPWWRRFGGHVWPRSSRALSERCSLAALRLLLNSEIGIAGLGDVRVEAVRSRTKVSTNFMIAAFDRDGQRQIFFRSDRKSRAVSFDMPTMATLAEAIDASCLRTSAIRQTNIAAWSGRKRCWGHAIGGYGNPVLAGISEVLASGVSPGDIEVLSIGTGRVVLPIAEGSLEQSTAKLVQQRGALGWANDRKRLAKILLHDLPDASNLFAHIALGQALPTDAQHPISTGALIRMNPLVQPVRTATGWMRPAGLTEAADASDEFVRLRNLPPDAADDVAFVLTKKLCSLWHGDAVLNQPIRANTDTFACEIGHHWYSEAKLGWREMYARRSTSSKALSTSPNASTPQPRAEKASWSKSPARLGGAVLG